MPPSYVQTVDITLTVSASSVLMVHTRLPPDVPWPQTGTMYRTMVGELGSLLTEGISPKQTQWFCAQTAITIPAVAVGCFQMVGILVYGNVACETADQADAKNGELPTGRVGLQEEE